MPVPAAAWADVVLRVLDVEYPHKSGHLTLSADDVDVTPTRLFPALAPLAAAIAAATLGWLPRLAYPVRNGMHSNTAFGLLLMHEAYGELGREDVVAAIDRHARTIRVHRMVGRIPA